MRKLLHLNDPAVKSLNQILLKGQALLGRGAFSLVYQDPRKLNKVTKLTVDQFNHLWLNDLFSPPNTEKRSPHAPKCFNDFGDVGEVWRNGQTLPVFAYEMEFLHPLGVENKRLVKALESFLCAAFVERKDFPDRSTLLSKLILSSNMGSKLKKSLAAYFTLLGEAARLFDEGLNFDLCNQNFRQRRDGTLVITDPVCSKDLLKLSYR